jgi:hypothetical protein
MLCQRLLCGEGPWVQVRLIDREENCVPPLSSLVREIFLFDANLVTILIFFQSPP